MIRNLVFEGGGVKGIAYGGALQVLQHAGILGGIQRVAGTSAGAITAVLVAVGYTPHEITRIIAETDFRDFLDDEFGVIRDANRLLCEFGWHKGAFFRDWIRSLIRRRVGKAGITFAELAAMDYLDLYLVGTDLTQRRSIVFSADATPDMRICDAARISMGVPLFFQCVRDGDSVLVDGGVACNYPLHIFDTPATATADPVINHETMGFRLDSRDEIDVNQDNWGNARHGILSIYDYLSALLGYMYAMANKRHLVPADKARTVFIDTMDVGTLDFYLSPTNIDALIESGRHCTQSYLAKNSLG